MIKPQTNHKQSWVEKPQTDVIAFDHEKAFRDLGSGFVVVQFDYCLLLDGRGVLLPGAPDRAFLN